MNCVNSSISLFGKGCIFGAKIQTMKNCFTVGFRGWKKRKKILTHVAPFFGLPGAAGTILIVILLIYHLWSNGTHFVCVVISESKISSSSQFSKSCKGILSSVHIRKDLLGSLKISPTSWSLHIKTTSPSSSLRLKALHNLHGALEVLFLKYPGKLLCWLQK